MSDQLYSAEEAAAILGLQVRTVRNYVRDGRLAGVRIGKQYRIARDDLEAFAGGGSPSVGAGGQGPVRVHPVRRRLDVSSVIELDGVDAAAADRVTRTVDALLAGRVDGAAPLRVEPLYDEDRSRLRLIVVGEAGDTVEIIRLVDALSQGP
jgi:excisionase family DNA binding protein